MPPFWALEGITKRSGETIAAPRRGVALARGAARRDAGADRAREGKAGRHKTLRLIAGSSFEAPDAGRVLVEGEDLSRGRGGSRGGSACVPSIRALSASRRRRDHCGVRARVVEGARRRVTANGGAGALALVDLAGYERRRPLTQHLRRLAAARGGGRSPVRLAPRAAGAVVDEPLCPISIPRCASAPGGD